VKLLTKTTLYIATLSLFLFFIMGIIFFQVLKKMSLSDLNHTMEGLKEVPNTENDASLRFWAIEHIALMIFLRYQPEPILMKLSNRICKGNGNIISPS